MGFQKSAWWTVLALAGCCLTGCTSLENGYVDALTFEGDLPPEARALRSHSASDLVEFGPPGVREFEIARRFEHGVDGFPLDRRCALVFNDISGSRTTRIRQDLLRAGTQTLTYLGFPNGRAAARRLRRSDTVPVTTAEADRCDDVVQALASSAG